MADNNEYEIVHNYIYLYLKYIYHGDTRKAFYLQNFIPDGDIGFWEELI